MKTQLMSVLVATGLVFGASASFAKASKKEVKAASAACKSEMPGASKKEIKQCVKGKLKG